MTDEDDDGVLVLTCHDDAVLHVEREVLPPQIARDLKLLDEDDPVIPLYIFDLDGTLADIEHRRHWVEQKPPDWAGFFRACVDDTPNWPVISTMLTLLDKGCDVWIWSGRSAEVMNETRTWLQRVIDAERLEEVLLTMRREGDYTPDEVLKEGWLQLMSEYDRRRLVAVFDDRDKVVAMWRRNGVACFQVAPGSF